MKKWLLIVLLLSFYFMSQSQVLDEWINQNATQKKYLLQQIAALKVYIGYLEKGYDIAKKGLNTISDIKNGHFNLDQDFFASLQNINPKVSKYAKVTDIITMNIKIVRFSKQTMKNARESYVMNNGEIKYMNTVFNALVDGCTDLTNEMMELITAGKLKMSDDERLKRIDAIYDDMEDRMVFVNAFGNQIKILTLQKEHEAADVKSTKSLFAN